jgi:hypothetical protein
MEGVLLNVESPWSLGAARLALIYAQFLINSGRPSEAGELLAVVEEQIEAIAGNQAVLTAEVYFLQAAAVYEEKHFDEARAKFKAGLEILRTVPGIWPGVLLNLLVNYSHALVGGNVTEADLMELREVAITATKSDFPAGASDALNLWMLADTLIFHGLETGVWPLIDKALEIDKKLQPDGLTVARDQNLRSVLFSKEGDFKAAEVAARDGLLIVARHPESAPTREEILGDLIRNYRDHLRALKFEPEQIEARIANLLRGEGPEIEAPPGVK